MNFDIAFDRLIGHEGGYSNDPRDPGGETMWGITIRVARAHGYNGPMKDMPRSVAKRIYKASYWDKVGAHNYHPAIGFQVFDAAVNHGVGQAVKFLQRAVGSTADGIIGPRTLAAINDKPVEGVVLGFNAERLKFYTSLSTWSAFGKGWTRRVANNLAYAAEDVK